MVLVSVVVPTRNRPEGLRACLDALSAQTVADFDVLLGDDASDVPASDLVTSDLRGRLDIRVLRNDAQRGPAFTRNRAIEAARGEYIAFVDDDVRVVPTWLETHLAAHTHSADALASIGPLAAPADWDAEPWTRWEARTLQREYDRMARGVYAPTWRQFHTGNAVLARAALQDVGGFDDSFGRAEDIEAARRMAARGLEFTFLPEAIGWHYSHRTMDAWLAVAHAYGGADWRMDRMYPESGWLAQVERELARRHPALRTIRRLTEFAGRPRWLARVLAGTGGVLDGLHMNRGASAALSAAYELEYLRGLEAAAEESFSLRTHLGDARS